MKKILFFLFLIPFFVAGQSTDGTLTTQNNTTIRGANFNSKNHANMFKGLIDSKLNLRGGTMPDNFIFLDPTGTLNFNVGGGMSNNPSGVQIVGVDQAYIGRVSTGLRFDASGVTFNLGGDVTGDLYQKSGVYFTRLAAVSAGSFLRSGGVGTVSAWSTVKLPTTMSALGLWVANSANTTVNLTATAGQSIRVNAGGTAWEAYTPGGGGIGGSTGATDNALLRADGTGGSTLQNSGIIIDDSGNVVFGTGLSGTARTLSANGSGTNVGFLISTKGTGGIEADGQFYTTESASLSSFLAAMHVGTGSISSPMNQLAFFPTSAGASLIHTRLSAGTGNFNITAAQGHASTVTGANLVLTSGAAHTTGNNNAGHIYLMYGVKNGSGLDGNIGLLTNTVSNWQGMERGIFINNRLTAPTAGIANGVALFAEDLGSSSELYTVSESGAKYNITGLITNVLLSGTTLTLTEAHRGAFIYCTSSSAVTITVPAGLPLGFNCTILQDHATGTVTVTGSGGTTINGKTSTGGLHDKIGLNLYKATDVYIGI